MFFAEAIIGSRIPHLTYIVTYEDLGLRDRLWSEFGSDPDWQKLRSPYGRRDRVQHSQHDSSSGGLFRYTLVVTARGNGEVWKAVLVSKRGITVRKSSIKITIAFCCMGLLAGMAAAQQPYTTWHSFGGTASDSNYSALSQINRSNVTKLQVAWKYDTATKAAYQLAPIVVDRTLYGPAKDGSLVAIDATTGKEIWVHRFPAGGGRGGFGGSGLTADQA